MDSRYPQASLKTTLQNSKKGQLFVKRKRLRKEQKPVSMKEPPWASRFSHTQHFYRQQCLWAKRCVVKKSTHFPSPHNTGSTRRERCSRRGCSENRRANPRPRFTSTIWCGHKPSRHWLRTPHRLCAGLVEPLSIFSSGTLQRRYVKFWHDHEVSLNGKSYGFCYDDVFDHSSTLHSQAPDSVTITLGVRANDITTVVEKKHVLTKEVLSVRKGNALHFSQPIFGTVEIVSARGQKIHTAQLKGENSLTLPASAAGALFWRVCEADGVWAGRIIP